MLRDTSECLRPSDGGRRWGWRSRECFSWQAAPYTALALCLMLFAVFPANVRAARNCLTIAGARVLPLVPRAVLQVVFIAATMAEFVGGREVRIAKYRSRRALWQCPMCSK